MNTESLCRFLRLPTFAGRRAKLEPETERQLQELATSLGRAPEELAKGARSAYLTELAEVRATSDLRCDDLKSGKVEAVDGTAALTPQRSNSGNNFGAGFILSGWPPWPGSDDSAISQQKPLAILDDLRGRRNPRVIGAFFFRSGSRSGQRNFGSGFDGDVDGAGAEGY